MGMGVGITSQAAALWLAEDPDSYNELFINQEGDIFWFVELPEWADSPTVGPFYVDEDGAIWSISIRPSQKGVLIGNVV